ncbi:MAG: hypothetical protein U1F77_04145 [Kiritimatiellia bacterium]
MALAGADYPEMDVTDPCRVQHGVEEAFQRHGGINIALGHAGGTGVFPFETCTQENRRDFSIQFHRPDLFRPLGAWPAVPPQLSAPSHFHLLLCRRIPMEGISAYVSAKAALEMFARNRARVRPPPDPGQLHQPGQRRRRQFPGRL